MMSEHKLMQTHRYEQRQEENDGDDDDDDDDDDGCDNDGAMNENTFEMYYPRRFVAARFFDSSRQKHCIVPLHESGGLLVDSGRVLASASARGKRKRPADDRRALQKFEALSSARITGKDMERLLRRTKARVLVSPRVFGQRASERMHVSQEVAWRVDQVKMIEYIMSSVPMVGACLDLLKNAVMSDGLKFMKDTLEYVPKREFSDYIVRRWHPFAYDLIDAYFTLGIIPIAYEYDPVSDECWPYVPRSDAYIIKRHTVNGAIRYRFYWNNAQAATNSWQQRHASVAGERVHEWLGRGGSGSSWNSQAGEYDPDVEIHHQFGYEINCHGFVTSKVATLVRMAETRRRVERARVIAEMNGAMPMLVTEYDASVAKKTSPAFKEGSYADAGAPTDFATSRNPEAVEEAVFKRNEYSQQALAYILRENEAETGRDAADEFGVDHADYRRDGSGVTLTQRDSYSSEGVPLQTSNQYHLAIGRKIAALPTPHASGDFVNVLQYYDSETCSALGVPEDAVRGNITSRAGTEVIDTRLNSTVRALKSMLSKVLTHVNNVIFFDEDIADYINHDYERRRATGDPRQGPTPDNLRVGNELRNLKVGFAKKMSETPDELFQLWALKAISWKTLCCELARRNGFEEAQACEEDGAGHEDGEHEGEADFGRNRGGHAALSGGSDDDDDDGERDDDNEDLTENARSRKIGAGKKQRRRGKGTDAKVASHGFTDKMRHFFLEPMVKYYQQEATERQHEDTMKLQNEQASQNLTMKTAELRSKEKQAKSSAAAMSGDSSRSKSANGKGADDDNDEGAGKEDSATTSITTISKAASMLAQASATSKKKKKEEEGKKKQK